MPPAPRSQEAIERRNIASISIHSLLITAIVIDLVFTAANRADNDTTPFVSTSAPAPSRLHADVRPVRRLVAFGCSFVAYLAFKSYEIILSSDWFVYKQIIDEISVVMGAASLLLLISTTSLKFAYFVALPVFGILFIGRFIFLWARGCHDCVLETMLRCFCTAPAIDSEVIANV